MYAFCILSNHVHILIKEESESIETEIAFLSVVRYIHQNPVKAGIVSRIEDYQWSSYRQYLNAYNGFRSVIDTDLLLPYYNKVEDFKSFNNTDNNDNFLEYRPTQKYSDDELRKAILNKYIIDDIENLPTKERNIIIKKIYQEFGVSIVQLSRVLGVGRGIVQRAVCQRDVRLCDNYFIRIYVLNCKSP